MRAHAAHDTVNNNNNNNNNKQKCKQNQVNTVYLVPFSFLLLLLPALPLSFWSVELCSEIHNNNEQSEILR